MTPNDAALGQEMQEILPRLVFPAFLLGLPGGLPERHGWIARLSRAGRRA